MSYETTLNIEIDKELDRLAGLKQAWRPQFIAHAVCRPHETGLADDEHKDFWRHCGYEKVRDAVRRRINARAGDRPAEKATPLLPGYEHLHEYYVVKRKGDDIAVHIDDMSDVELDQKTELYRSLGRGCFDHADEFQRFKRDRRSALAKRRRTRQ